MIDVGYRLAPEHKYPIPVQDSLQAYQYITKHARELNIDPHRIAVGGFSAGGHIAAVISQQARDRSFSYPPCFQLLVIPVCDATVLTSDIQLADGRQTVYTPESMSLTYIVFALGCPYESWKENYHAPFLSFARMSVSNTIPPAVI